MAWNIVVSALLLAGAAAPQGDGAGAAPGARVVGVDPNGWPIIEQVEAEGAPAGSPSSARLRSDFDRSEASRPFAVATAPAVRHPLPGAGPRTEPSTTAAPPLDLDSPLRDVFRRVGQPVDAQDLGGIVVWCRMTLRDQRGAEVGRREFSHEADLGADRRDRLLLPGRKVYGRDGAHVFAELHRLPMPSYEREAREELDILGVLLRVPWVFADVARFRVVGAEPIEVAGRRLLAIRIERSRAGDPDALDPIDRSEPGSGTGRAAPLRAGDASGHEPGEGAGVDATDHFELRCLADSLEPVELRYQLAASQRVSTVRLSDYRRVGGVRIPMTRSFVDGSGGSAMVIELLRFDPGQTFPRSQFRPLR